MVTALPAEEVQQRIQSTANIIGETEADIVEALGYFVGEDFTDILEAMEIISTCEVGVIRSYLNGVDVLDEYLDDYMIEVA